MLAFALWRRLWPHEMLVRINKTTRGPPSVYKRVMPNGGHQALHAKKPCSTRGPKSEVQTCPVQGFSASPNPRCGLLLPQKRPMASTAAAILLVRSEKHGPWAVRVVPSLALGAIALLAVPHALDTLTGWTMDRYIGHSVPLWRPE